MRMHTKFWWIYLKGRARGKSKYRWEDNIKMDLRKIGWEVVDYGRLAQDRDKWQALMNTIMNIQLP
jgi:hypothetical protein